ncbi:MAG: 1-hydroxycarotenoid 3,4-desaturase CrtD [Bacteroidota bacterium]|nr:1-hydroxycarotenoid 3,4-desaturase CrtD [Bacteroidota bacterium]MEC8239266.1 1-hydroxycarotenoid 3,4-desaturase CrtD [Bacteroidota bacterium]
MSNKVIIIGSGIAGIATSIRLACQGYDVSVFEKNEHPGGKLSSFKLGDYRFDFGPSLFTMPHFVDELFTLAGENPRDHFQYKRKEIGCKYYWEDGVRLNAYGDNNRFLEEVDNTLGVPKHQLQNYLEQAQKKYNRTFSIFLEKSLHKLDTYLNKATVKGILHLFSYELETTLHKVNTRRLQEPHLVQFYDRFATYNGSNPYQTPGMMTLIQHLEQHYGTFVPEKGMVDITNSLVALAKRKGVQFHLNTAVEEIVIERQLATGIRVNGTIRKADVVVSNMDVVPTYRHLMPTQKAPEKSLQQERSSSAVIFYWGIDRSFPDLDLHNIFFSDNYQAEFDAIFRDKTLFDDPTVYVNITSKDVHGDAPAGKENWFVMVNAPHDTGQDWDALSKTLKKQVLDKLNRNLTVDLANHIEEEWVLTPPLIADKTASFTGALYGAASNNRMAAFLRHPNFSRHISGLYFCGGSVHPGGGIPLCLLSAKIVADLVKTA